MTKTEKIAHLFERMRANTKEGRALRRAFEAGAEAAADLADQYNGSTTHDYCLGDCILGKMNIRKARPRKNERRILSHKELLEILGPRRRGKVIVYLPR